MSRAGWEIVWTDKFLSSTDADDGLHRSSGAKNRRHQDDKNNFITVTLM